MGSTQGCVYQGTFQKFKDSVSGKVLVASCSHVRLIGDRQPLKHCIAKGEALRQTAHQLLLGRIRKEARARESSCRGMLPNMAWSQQANSVTGNQRVGPVPWFTWLSCLFCLKLPLHFLAF